MPPRAAAREVDQLAPRLRYADARFEDVTEALRPRGAGGEAMKRSVVDLRTARGRAESP